jgi:hypothetical protein
MAADGSQEMRMRKFAAFVVFAAALALSPAAAQDQRASPPTVTGKWTMTVDSGPHGTMTMGLVLEQQGTKVTGTFASPHGDMPVEGEFVDDVLKLATTVENVDSQITFQARLIDDGVLSGYLSSQIGDMKWTAERVKERQ